MKRILILHRYHSDLKFGKNRINVDNLISKDTPSFSYGVALRNMGYYVDDLIYHQFFNNKKQSSCIFYRVFAKLERETVNYFRRRKFYKKLDIYLKNNRLSLLIMASQYRGIKPLKLKKLKDKYNFNAVILNGLALKHGTKWDENFAKVVDMNALINETQVSEFRSKGAIKPMAIPITGCANEIHKNIKRDENFICDVGFVGSLKGEIFKYDNRIKILNELTEFDLGIWCPDVRHLNKAPNLRRFYKGSVSRSEAPKIYSKCKIMINIHGQHVYEDLQGGGNLSLFEIPASGGFQIADMCDPKWFIVGQQIITFDNIMDLKEKISYYLKNYSKREGIAQAGRTRALSTHTFEDRFKIILNNLNLS